MFNYDLQVDPIVSYITRKDLYPMIKKVFSYIDTDDLHSEDLYDLYCKACQLSKVVPMDGPVDMPEMLEDYERYL